MGHQQTGGELSLAFSLSPLRPSGCFSGNAILYRSNLSNYGNKKVVCEGESVPIVSQSGTADLHRKE